MSSIVVNLRRGRRLAGHVGVGIRRLARHPYGSIRCLAAIERGSGQEIGGMLRTTQNDDALARTTIDLMSATGVVSASFRRDGLVWRSDFGDEIGPILFRTGGYETDEIDAVIAWLRAEEITGTVVDVGANIGTTSLPFANAGFPVVAIEPVPAIFAMLAENIEVNDLSARVSCIHGAVAAAEGDVQLWTGSGSGQGEVVVPGQEPALLRWGPEGEVVIAPAAPLQVHLERIGVPLASVGLVWADVQGSESSVIRTGGDLWQRGVPLYLEVDPVSLELHGGFEDFCGHVTTHFATFLTRDDLIARRSDRRPITDFSTWASAIDARSFGDALLVP